MLSLNYVYIKRALDFEYRSQLRITDSRAVAESFSRRALELSCKLHSRLRETSGTTPLKRIRHESLDWVARAELVKISNYFVISINCHKTFSWTPPIDETNKRHFMAAFYGSSGVSSCSVLLSWLGPLDIGLHIWHSYSHLKTSVSAM